MSTVKTSDQKRRRRTPDEARLEAVASARLLLLESGPDSVTLAAVGKRIGVTHPNLIHHFGSAAGLQSALMASMVSDLVEALDDAVLRLRTDQGAPMDVVNAVFDAFAQGGAGRLAAWIALSGDLGHLQAVRAAVGGLVEAIRDKLGDPDGQARERIRSAVLFIALGAFGDALIGPPLRDMLDRDEEAARRITADLLPHFLVQPPRR